MSNKQTTAVQWLIEQTRTPAWRSLKRCDIIELAKAIERKQIEDAINNSVAKALLDYFNNLGKTKEELIIELEKGLPTISIGEDYFTSTFITE